MGERGDLCARGEQTIKREKQRNRETKRKRERKNETENDRERTNLIDDLVGCERRSVHLIGK